MEVREPAGPQPTQRTTGNIRHVEGARNSLPQGRAHELVSQYKTASSEIDIQLTLYRLIRVYLG